MPICIQNIHETKGRVLYVYLVADELFGYLFILFSAMYTGVLFVDCDKPTDVGGGGQPAKYPTEEYAPLATWLLR